MPKTEDVVLEYMRSQNRPYSALDIHLNLHKAEGKTAVVKALEKLGSEGKLLEKTYGKSKIYVYHQSQFPKVDEASIKNMDVEISKLNAQLEEAKTANKNFTFELKQLVNSLTSEEADTRLKILEKEVTELTEKCKSLRKASKNFDPTKKNEVTKNNVLMVNNWKKRKRMTTDVINAVLEGYPKSKKQFFEEVGIETDEDCQVSIPTT